jgi:hypothetical protein
LLEYGLWSVRFFFKIPYQSEIAGALFAFNVFLMFTLPISVIAWIEPDVAADDAMNAEA